MTANGRLVRLALRLIDTSPFVRADALEPRSLFTLFSGWRKRASAYHITDGSDLNTIPRPNTGDIPAPARSLTKSVGKVGVRPQRPIVIGPCNGGCTSGSGPGPQVANAEWPLSINNAGDTMNLHKFMRGALPLARTYVLNRRAWAAGRQTTRGKVSTCRNS